LTPELHPKRRRKPALLQSKLSPEFFEMRSPQNRLTLLHRAKGMAEVTYYVALPFVIADDGVAAGEPAECFNPNAAVLRAEALSRKEGNVGAVAFSRTGDPATGEIGDVQMIGKFGEVPDDLSAL
jgi:hypothetical protein